MNEHIEITKTAVEVAQTHSPLVAIAAKKYFLLAGVILFGAVAHAIEDARKSGWKGLGWFCANTFVAAFVGMLFAQIASMISTEWMYAAGGMGGYMGPMAFKYVRNATLSRLGLTEAQNNDNQ